jgi:quercetin dioxygenase-like cupin family protein
MTTSKQRILIVFAITCLVAACKSGPPPVPYPAFVSVDGLPEMFIAGLPGVRAKPLVGATSDTAGGGYRIDLPSTWQGTSGASPDKTLEIFVVSGELSVADIKLKRGGYAYLPPGTLGFKLKSATGARVLYFLDDIDPTAVIKTPLILESGLLDWEESGDEGLATKELRSDPGTGARTGLLRIEPGAEIPWQSSSVNREGYFLAGSYTHSECVAGDPATDLYAPGGYVYRPAHSISGGPESAATSTSIWFYRELSGGIETTHDKCEVTVTGY